MGAFSLFRELTVMVLRFFKECVAGVTEKQGDAPDRREGDQNINDPAHYAALTAADEADEVKLKDTDAAPVEAADDQQRERDFVKHLQSSFTRKIPHS